MSPLLRPARDSDLEALVGLLRSWPGLPAWSRAGWREELSNPRVRVLVVEEDGRPAGCAVVTLVADEAQVGMVAVRPEAVRRGLGRVLLGGLLEEARAAGCVKASLEVGEGNLPARRLYETEGFRIVGRRMKYYNDGSDALLMDKGLAP